MSPDWTTITFAGFTGAIDAGMLTGTGAGGCEAPSMAEKTSPSIVTIPIATIAMTAIPSAGCSRIVPGRR
ncbi:MAG: hypothetical protein JST73_05690 [Actinobacteria bacterium]|nr:hypothetical protein [Actinomycetota bacterium]